MYFLDLDTNSRNYAFCVPSANPDYCVPNAWVGPLSYMNVLPTNMCADKSRNFKTNSNYEQMNRQADIRMDGQRSLYHFMSRI